MGDQCPPTTAKRQNTGCARLRTGAGQARRVKGCLKGFRWAAICSWLITPAGYSATATQPEGKRGQVRFAGTAQRVLRTKRTCPLFPSLLLLRRIFDFGETSTLRPVASGFAKSPSASACDACRTCAGARLPESQRKPRSCRPARIGGVIPRAPTPDERQAAMLLRAICQFRLRACLRISICDRRVAGTVYESLSFRSLPHSMRHYGRTPCCAFGIGQASRRFAR
jgi:hypothetical protein